MRCPDSSEYFKLYHYPGEQAEDQSSAAANDLARQSHERVEKRAKLNLQQRPFLFPMRRLPAAGLFRQPQGGPGLSYCQMLWVRW